MIALHQITLETTDEQLEAGLKYAQAALVDAATQGQFAQELIRYVDRVAEEEALHQVASTVRNMRKFRLVDESMEDANQKVRDFLISRLCANPDDTWSGRGRNHIARVKNDAVRDAVSNAIELL